LESGGGAGAAVAAGGGGGGAVAAPVEEQTSSRLRSRIPADKKVDGDQGGARTDGRAKEARTWSRRAALVKKA